MKKPPASLKCSAYADLVAVSRDGQAIIASREDSSTLSVWSAAGGVALVEVDGSAKDLATLDASKLHVVPASGSPTETAIKLGFEQATLVTVSRRGIVCLSNGSGVGVVTLAGKRLWASAGHTVEYAAVARDGDAVIAAAGNIARNHPADVARKTKFPKPEMAEGYIGVFDAATGALRSVAPRKKAAVVRAMALADGVAVVLGQDSAAEIAAWPV